MSDIAKWAILIAVMLSLIILVLTLPFVAYINFEDLSNSFATITDIAGNFMYSARSIINMFLFDFARDILSGVIIYLFGKWFITLSIKITSWIVHFIFK